MTIYHIVAIVIYDHYTGITAALADFYMAFIIKYNNV